MRVARQAHSGALPARGESPIRRAAAAGNIAALYYPLDTPATVSITLFCVGLIAVGIGVALVLLAVLDALTPPFTMLPAPVAAERNRA